MGTQQVAILSRTQGKLTVSLGVKAAATAFRSAWVTASSVKTVSASEHTS